MIQFDYKRGLCAALSVVLAVTSCVFPTAAEELTAEDIVTETALADEIPVEMESDAETEIPGSAGEALRAENWMNVANEVLLYFSATAIGPEPSISYTDWLFYDVIADRTINIVDAAYFLSIFATLGTGVAFDGYIPRRNGEPSPLTKPAGTTAPEETTITTTEMTTTTASSESETETETTEVTSSMDETMETTQTTTKISTENSSSSAASKTTTVSKTTTSKTSTIKTTTGKTTTIKTKTTTDETTTDVSDTDATTTPSDETTTTTTTTVITRTPLTWGIDVSVYQGKVDWETVKEEGVDFAIIRAGYGKHLNQEDKYFDTNMKGAKEAGIDCGAYWFSYATTPEAAIQEADVFYEVIKEYEFEYPVFFDYETNAQFELDSKESTEIIHAFCKRMESYGYYVSLCSYVYFMNTRIEPEIYNQYDAWIAHYDVQVPNFKYSHGMWQYSSTGTVGGIEGPVDLDYAYYDYPQIMKDCGLNGF